MRGWVMLMMYRSKDVKIETTTEEAATTTEEAATTTEEAATTTEEATATEATT
ncbi:hypothetical protein IKI14_01915 [bacterium]|nr:hypothetical protein [bacterium]